MPHAFKPIFVMIKILIIIFFDNFEVVHTFTNRFQKVGAIITSKTIYIYIYISKIII